MKVVEIKKTGEMNELTICKKRLLYTLKKIADSHGTNEIRLLYTWRSGPGISTLCYGWCDGDAGLENKHDMPPNGVSDFLEEDSSTILLFGSLFMLRKEGRLYVDTDVSDYSLFYSECFCGFDDCSDEESSDDEEPNSDDIKFIDVDDNEGGNEDYKPDNDSCEELDIDENEYE